MFNWLIKLFTKKEVQDMEQNIDQANSNPSPTPPSVPKKRKHKLEIQVYEADYEKADAHNG